MAHDGEPERAPDRLAIAQDLADLINSGSDSSLVANVWQRGWRVRVYVNASKGRRDYGYIDVANDGSTTVEGKSAVAQATIEALLNPTVVATEPANVELYEDKAGGLVLVCAGAAYGGLERQPAGSFLEDARTLSEGDVHLWSHPRVDHERDHGALVAAYDGASDSFAVQGTPGVSAIRYMGVAVVPVVDEESPQ